MSVADVSQVNAFPSIYAKNSIGLSSVMQIAPPQTSNIFLDKITSVDAQIRAADVKILDYVSGKDVPIHDVLMSLNRVKSELTLMVQIRNKVLEAYQEISRLQI